MSEVLTQKEIQDILDKQAAVSALDKHDLETDSILYVVRENIRNQLKRSGNISSNETLTQEENKQIVKETLVRPNVYLIYRANELLCVIEYEKDAKDYCSLLNDSNNTYWYKEMPIYRRGDGEIYN